VDSQEPFTTGDSEPEPDVMVVRGALRDYPDGHPRAEHVALVVEVADTSLRTDRGTKKRAYARAGIPVYWIVNLVDRCIEVYTDPTGPTEEPDYHQRREYSPNETIAVVFDGVEVGALPVAELLP
jgi:Uma2 family endonuclease